MRIDLFQPTVEGEARVLLLIEAFSRNQRALEGRTKLAKLDFFLRYPAYLSRALTIRNVPDTGAPREIGTEDIETRMVRYRYGPWDPAYYAILGRLLGKGLVVGVPLNHGVGYSVTERGRETALSLAKEPIWQDITTKIELLRKHLNFSGTNLKKFVYEHFPEVTQATWGKQL